MKHTTFLLAATAVALASFGCGDDSGSGGSTTTTSTTTGTTTTSGSTTSSTTASTTSATSSSSTGMAVCPPDAMDDPCTACSKASCCDQTTACTADAECTACFACVTTAMNPADCITMGQCDLADPETAAAYDCTAPTCSDECYAGGFSCTPDMMGDPCIECVKADCCMEGQECFESAACAACISCAQSAANPLDCVNMRVCDLTDPATSDTFSCVNTNCSICLGG